jgi:hypothetical protein
VDFITFGANVMLSLTRKIKSKILPFPMERVSQSSAVQELSAQIYILPSIRIERHDDHPDKQPKLKRKRA